MTVMHTPDQVQPYLDESTERVFEANDLQGDIHLTCGIAAERVNIDPDGVTVSAFRRFENSEPGDRETHIRLINQSALAGQEQAQLVWDREEALEREFHAVWVMTDGDVVEYPHPLAGNASVSEDATVRLPADVYVYERIPFAKTVESVTGLEAELEVAFNQLSETTLSLTLD